MEADRAVPGRSDGVARPQPARSIELIASRRYQKRESECKSKWATGFVGTAASMVVRP